MLGARKNGATGGLDTLSTLNLVLISVLNWRDNEVSCKQLTLFWWHVYIHNGHAHIEDHMSQIAT